MDDIFIGWIII